MAMLGLEAGALGLAALTGIALTGCGGDTRSSVDASLLEDAGPEIDADIEVDTSACESRAGTRLTREFIEPTPGARQEFQIIDTQDDVACSFVAESDSTFTCYPNITGGSLFFQDSNCISAIVGFGVGATPTKFNRVTRSSQDGCSTISEYRRIGAESAVSGGQSIFEIDGSGACVPRLAPNRDYYLAGPRLAPTDFVNGDQQLVALGPRISAQSFAGLDGSNMCGSATRAKDTTLDAPCTMRLAADSQTRCIPDASSLINFFSDMECTQAVQAVTLTACTVEPPQYAFANESGECGATLRHLLPVSATPIAQRFQLAGDVCNENIIEGNSYLALGDEIEPATLPTITTASEAIAGGRLQRELLTSEDGFTAFNGSWLDTSLDLPCTFRSAADGSLRCLPTGMTIASFFSDATCTSPISLALVDSCQAPAGFFTSSSPLGTRMLAAVPHEAPVFQQDGACVPIAGSFFKPGFEVQPSSFALGELQRLELSQ